MRIVFLSLAVKDLASIRAYIAADNPEAAQMVAARLRKLIQGWPECQTWARLVGCSAPGNWLRPRWQNFPLLWCTGVREEPSGDPAYSAGDA